MPPRKPNPIHRTEYTAFRAVLSQMRRNAGLTFRGLAAKMDRPVTWVHKCEAGLRRMDVPEFLEWCDACGVGFARAARMLKNH